MNRPRRMLAIVPVLVVAVLVVFAAGADAGGKLTLQSLDKRMRALTALVLLDEKHPPQARHYKVDVPAYSLGNGVYDGEANCAGDDRIVSGGYSLTGGSGDVSLIADGPEDIPSWHVRLQTGSYNGVPPLVTVTAICEATP